MHTFRDTAIIDLFMHALFPEHSVSAMPDPLCSPNLFIGVIGFTWDSPILAVSLILHEEHSAVCLLITSSH